jgi:nucleoside transporter
MHDPQPAPLSFSLASRLSFMMFLQYAIWGAWLPLMYQFLSRHRGFKDGEIGYLFMIGGVGAVVAPFIAGQVADRHFNTEKYLGLSHIIGGVLVWQLSWITDYWGFFAFSLLYSLIYSPTLALTNSLSFHHLPDRDRDFGKVRLWGTIGWIAVGIGIGQWLLHHHTPVDGTEAEKLAAQAAGIRDAFRLSAILGIAMGLYCFTLPKTPPSRGRQSYAVGEALAEIRYNPLLTLFLIAVPISCIHQFYFVHTSAFLNTYQAKVGEVAEGINSLFGVGGGGLMTIGQMSEIIVLALIPFFAKRVSRKTLLLIGIAAYALRMFLFAHVDALQASIGLEPMVTLIAGVALHGLCFGLFVFVAFMVVDEETTADVRASAQSLFGLVIFGIGIIVGSLVAGYVGDWASSRATVSGLDPSGGVGGGGAMNYHDLFEVPMWGAIACFALMLAFYPRQGRRTPAIEHHLGGP